MDTGRSDDGSFAMVIVNTTVSPIYYEKPPPPLTAVGMSPPPSVDGRMKTGFASCKDGSATHGYDLLS